VGIGFAVPSDDSDIVEDGDLVVDDLRVCRGSDSFIADVCMALSGMNEDADERVECVLPLPLRTTERMERSELADDTEGDNSLSFSGAEGGYDLGVSVTSCKNLGDALRWTSEDVDATLAGAGDAFGGGCRSSSAEGVIRLEEPPGVWGGGWSSSEDKPALMKNVKLEPLFGTPVAPISPP